MFQPKQHLLNFVSNPYKEIVNYSIEKKKREGKSEVKYSTEDVKEESLTREYSTHNGQLPVYKVEGGGFEGFPEIHPRSIEKLKARSIQSLFPIQQHTFYPIYHGEDLIARDLTGSGKTLAFGLPIIE